MELLHLVRAQQTLLRKQKTYLVREQQKKKDIKIDLLLIVRTAKIYIFELCMRARAVVRVRLMRGCCKFCG